MTKTTFLVTKTTSLVTKITFVVTKITSLATKTTSLATKITFQVSRIIVLVLLAIGFDNPESLALVHRNNQRTSLASFAPE